MKIHELKSWPRYFEATYLGYKDFDYRKNDRDYKVGDILRLREWDNSTENFSGRWLVRMVTYICNDAPGLAHGFVIMQTIPCQSSLVPKRISSKWW